MTSLDLFRLDGQSAVVTGGAGGLGAAIARGLAEAGAAVCVADRNARQGTLVAEALARAGHRALALEVDVTSPDAVERMAADVEARLGPIDVLVNSAGITHRSPAADFPEAEWHRVIAVNLTGVFLACQVVGRRMIGRRRGRIVNLASIAGQIGLTGTVAYAASKGDMDGFEVAARDCAAPAPHRGDDHDAVVGGATGRRHAVPGPGRGRLLLQARPPVVCRHPRRSGQARPWRGAHADHAPFPARSPGPGARHAAQGQHG